MPEYVPRKGDFIAVSFDPQSGHEQKGRRPALVVSNDLFNRHTGLAIVCPPSHHDAPELPLPRCPFEREKRYRLRNGRAGKVC